MAFQTPITIVDAISRIEKNEFLLPAIQREFEWSSEKIEWLFDSLMKDYPISSFLFWKVEESTARSHKFYKFLNEYREFYKIHNDDISTNGIGKFYAILDGQQRLTSLYIGLKGSYAYKEYRRKWEDSEYSIPTRHLYLNISKKLENEEDGREYDFKFLNKSDTEEKEIYEDGKQQLWFRVGKILNYKNEEKFDNFVESLNESLSRIILRKLRRVVFERQIINYFVEEEQDLDKALNIFIRVNSGGKPLDFSDLIMSIAIANWESKDARKEIHSLVDVIREKGFNISKDLILKAYLYLYSKDIKFKVTNFSKENAIALEKNWDDIRDCIIETFELLKNFGFNDYTLTSKNAALPVIYYLYHRDIYTNFSSRKEFERDRELIKKWLHKVLIKRIFGGSSDSMLSQIRQTFTDNVSEVPLKENFEVYPEIKDFNVDDDFVEELLLTQKDDKYAFSILSLLYPYLDYKNGNFHKDHLHPISEFKQLTKEDKEKYQFKEYNSICNLQLLFANENESKNSSSLKVWVERSTTELTRLQFLEQHIIPNVDLSLENFSQFFEERKKLLVEKLKNLLN